MRAALGGPRLLLRRLREIMAEPINAQVRLDKIVINIASNMVAEVCSVYVQRSDGRLELFATEGLKREAVHLTTMRAGEGLVGLIASTAEPLALSDAQANPAFSFRPETGEEIYQSFLGVPILRGGNTLGVLVVQNRARRVYPEEEVEVLETTAMLLAEMIASGELQSLAQPGAAIALTGAMSLKGVGIVEGVGLGYVVLHQPRVVVKKIVAEDTAGEAVRLDAAIEQMRAALDALIERGSQTGPGEHREILETFRMFANDRGWLRRLREAVATGLTAEAAVERVQNDARARLQRSTDPYMRERLHDLDELADRLLHQLTGQTLIVDQSSIPENAILVARSMGPAALLDYDRSRLRGLILEDGGASSHVAIVARSLGIAMVGNVSNITTIVETGDAIIIDGATGDVQVRPQPDVEAAYGEKARLRARRQEQYRGLRDVPSVSKDGVGVDLHMNAGLLVDARHVSESGAASIGLFRTELQFMVAAQFPRAAQQFSLYKSILDAVPDRPVTFRTLDIGGDKILPYMTRLDEENPALGWRALRIGLDRPVLLRAQLRALLRAGAGRELRIMFPMVTMAYEFDQAKAMVEREMAHLQRHGHGVPNPLKLGIMAEVPSVLWQLDEIMTRVDFVSVGSNDLFQYVMAVDRENKRVSGRYDLLSPPVLRALQSICLAGQLHQIPVTLCGEMGGRPIEAMALVALGYRGLSMSASSIGPVKAMLLALDVADLAHKMAAWLELHDGSPSIRPLLKEYASLNQIPL